MTIELFVRSGLLLVVEVPLRQKNELAKTQTEVAQLLSQAQELIKNSRSEEDVVRLLQQSVQKIRENPQLQEAGQQEQNPPPDTAKTGQAGEICSLRIYPQRQQNQCRTMDAVNKLGLWGLCTRGLPLRIFMICTLTGVQWVIYDAFKVFVGLLPKLFVGRILCVQAVNKLGLWGLCTRGLPLRIFMIGTLTGVQWVIYDAFKVFVGM
ncbi:hypothetical protein BUALT_Bualt02G0094100 [Buddleja alternifolia]|uniref:Uncharacterized protein n=1 Tax=Buddleja alternifolia TaxID=168488 RepID=A0AAV6Y6S7_9LAMI|nr:hypothetical protein BUALT_Bualt02G0094100 [Buddleja alternifolia]